MRILEKIEQIHKRIENMLASAKEAKYQELLKEYCQLYPRLEQKPEQFHLLQQMLKLYTHIEFDLWPKVNELFERNVSEYRRLMSLLLKVMQQFDREMSKLGFTFTAQPYLPVEERKTFNPKAVVRLQERVKELTEEMKENLEEAKIEEEAQKQAPLVKKKKKEENQENADQ